MADGPAAKKLEILQNKRQRLTKLIFCQWRNFFQLIFRNKNIWSKLPFHMNFSLEVAIWYKLGINFIKLGSKLENRGVEMIKNCCVSVYRARQIFETINTCVFVNPLLASVPILYPPIKHQKTKGFLIFWGSIK